MIRQNIVLKKHFSYMENAEYEIEWLVANMSNVTKGIPLVKVSLFNHEKRQVQTICSECDGICYIHISDADAFYESEASLFGFVIDNVKDIETIFPCEIIESQDEFSGEMSLCWNRLGGLETIGIPLIVNGREVLYIKSIYTEGHLVLVLDFISKAVNMKKGDTLSLKFMSGQILDFTVGSRPAKVMGKFKFPDEEGNHIELFDRGANFSSYYFKKLFQRRKLLRETTFTLSTKDIKIFTDNLLCAWRITLNSEGGAIVGDEFQSSYFKKEVCPLILNNMFKTLLEHLKKYDNSFSEEALCKETDKGVDEEEFDYCYVYLMHDEANGYYKIGMSNNPVYREGTLQSEKPTISLVVCHKYPSRKFAAAIEAALHNVYKDNHVRGEWYKLTDKDVRVIVEGLK